MLNDPRRVRPDGLLLTAFAVLQCGGSLSNSKGRRRRRRSGAFTAAAAAVAWVYLNKSDERRQVARYERCRRWM